MAQVKLDDSTLVKIADKIREKNKEEVSYKPSEMPDAIGRILVSEPNIEQLEVTANGTYEAPIGVHGYNPVVVNTPSLTDEDLTFSGVCSYAFAYNNFNWLSEKYGDRITTRDITNTNGMFYQATDLHHVPFVINVNPGVTGCFASTFENSGLYELPQLNVDTSGMKIPTGPYSNHYDIPKFGGMKYLREVPENYLSQLYPEGTQEARKTYSCQGVASLFSGCFSLRKYCDLTPAINYGASKYNSMYNSLFQDCFSLDEIVNLPVEPVAYTSNVFSSTFRKVSRLKRMTFATNPDGSPIVAPWTNQIIDLSDAGTHSTAPFRPGDNGYWGAIQPINYNSGITADKVISSWDDDKYAELKDDPDLIITTATGETRLSLYTRDSAVETINSLPDCSAGGLTNKIIFDGKAGSALPCGAINTLTAEEIAVAEAKGWAVQFK